MHFTVFSSNFYGTNHKERERKTTGIWIKINEPSLLFWCFGTASCVSIQPSTRFQRWSPKISLKSAPFPPIPSTTKPNPPKRKGKHKDKQIRKKIKSNSDALRPWIAIVIVWRGWGEEFTVEKLGSREMEVESVMIALR